MKTGTNQRQSISSSFKAESLPELNKPRFSINILPIENTQRSINVSFYTDDGPGRQRFRKKQLPPHAALYAGLSGGDVDDEFLYSDLEEQTGTGSVEVKLSEYPLIARAWYNKVIRVYLSTHSYLIQANYLNDTIFWFLEGKTGEYAIFYKYTLKVSFDQQTMQLSLLVSWSGTSKILLRSLEEVIWANGIDPALFGKVVFNKSIYRFNQLPEEGLRNQGSVYPILNRELCDALGIVIPPQIESHPYRSDIRKIEAFYKKYLNNETFRGLVPVKVQWQTLPASSINRIGKPVTDLVFGNNEKGTEVHSMLKKRGPYRLIPGSSVTAFFIFHEEDKGAVAHLRSFLTGQNGSGGMMNYTKTPFYFNDHLNIVYTNKQNPLPEIEAAIRKLNLITGITYFAFYLSRFSRFGNTLQENAVYYKIRQALLSRGVVSQTMDKEKMINSGNSLSYWIPNIASAAVAKLGGIPWKPDGNTINELVVGFGLYTSLNYQRKYTGASVCFSNDGRFLEFDAYPSDEPWQMAATLEKALKRYLESHQTASRLIIHYFKDPSGREFDPVEKMLNSIDVKVPVIIVRVANSNSNPYYVHDHSSNYCIAQNGTYVEIFRNNYLLFLNDRHSAETEGSIAPAPLRVGLYCRNREVLSNPATVGEVLQQLNDFCYMHWRSMRQHRYPVTIGYARMLAEQASWFTDEPLPEAVRKLPWFI